SPRARRRTPRRRRRRTPGHPPCAPPGRPAPSSPPGRREPAWPSCVASTGFSERHASASRGRRGVTAIREYRAAPSSLVHPVDLADRADADALEALCDAVLVVGERAERVGEEVGVDHRLAALRVLLVDDVEERLLRRADAVVHRASVAAL